MLFSIQKKPGMPTRLKEAWSLAPPLGISSWTELSTSYSGKAATIGASASSSIGFIDSMHTRPPW